MTWLPHVTVATVVYRDGRYLLVHEDSVSGPVYNQPAGHLEEHETLLEAATRETFEETGWHVNIKTVLGVTLYRSNANAVTYVRVSFIAEAVKHDCEAQLDDGILAASWFSYEEILALKAQLRSPMVLGDIEKHRLGRSYPLDLLCSIPVQ